MPEPASNINVNPSPKARFIAVKTYVDAHRELIQRPDLQRGLDFALMQMMMDECQSAVDGNSAAAAAYKMAGAKGFIKILRELAETPAVAQRKPGEKEMTV